MTRQHKQKCSFCSINDGMVFCRDACGNVICYACTVKIPTGGFCISCKQRFEDIHGRNHHMDSRTKEYVQWLKDYKEKESEWIAK